MEEYELVGVSMDTTFLDENLPVGVYEYYVVAHYEMGCVADSSNHVMESVELGVKGVKELGGVRVWPNPTTGELQISGFGFRVTGVEVFDIYGRKCRVSRVTRHENTIDISHLQPGVYFVRVHTESRGWW